MADIVIRNVDEATLSTLKHNAERSGKSVEELIRDMIDRVISTANIHSDSTMSAEQFRNYARSIRARTDNITHTPAEVLKQEIYDERFGE